ncbi:DNA adenine methylase [candidate division KSB1 bacterium]|nr:MAG: DNA adenine methylase [candidate division KSB1 bacterium]
MRSPVVWLGGKSRLASRLDALLPQHNTYVEVYGGGASLLFHKRPSAVEVYNDIDEGLVNFFRVLRSPKKSALLKKKLSITPYSRTEFRNFCLTQSRKLSDVERAYRWFCIMRMSFGSQFGKSWGVSIHGSTQGIASCVHRFHTSAALLEQACNRFSKVVVECQDWRKLCLKYDSKETVLFLDPPYMPITRRGGCYDHEMTEGDHIDLLCFLSMCKSKVILCGYENPIYRIMLQKGWRKVSWPHRCCINNKQGSGNSRQHRTENVWLNYNIK